VARHNSIAASLDGRSIVTGKVPSNGDDIADRGDSNIWEIFRVLEASLGLDMGRNCSPKCDLNFRMKAYPEE
jgi:hypothetical protein